MEPNTKESGWIKVGMVMGFIYGLIIVDTKVIGKIIKPMVKVSSIIRMEIYSKVSGTMIWLMGSASISMLMEQFMKVIGKMIISMVSAKKYG